MRNFFLAVAAASIVVVGCGGMSDDDDSANSHVAVTPGEPCEGAGSTAQSTDGCNTCACSSEGTWTCTKKECGGGSACAEGATMDDGCNSCSCHDGQWACTTRYCGDPPDDPPPTGCPAPRDPDPNVSCAEVEVWAKAPDTGLCCLYGTSCVSPKNWAVFTNQMECEVGGSGICTPGQTSDDGCNSCTCTEDGWVCTDVACPVTCEPGETRRAEDGCNVCSCGDDGQWGGCTEIACDPAQSNTCGGFAGQTCTDDEYCAYEEGQLCGAADASATCEQRPQACDLVLDPVCGCDGLDYSNGCAANAAGVGILHSGECDAP